MQVGVEVTTDNCRDVGVGLDVENVFKGSTVVLVMVYIDHSE
jgi:hypothetical protein